MAALARAETWRTVLPCHAFDYVSAAHSHALLVLPGGSWEAFHAQPMRRRPVEATLRALAQRKWPLARNAHGNEIGPQVVGEARDLLELLGRIEEGFPRPETLEMLQEVALSLKANRKAIKSTLEVKRCSMCLRPESDLPDGMRLKACGRCRVAQYCSTECQVSDWKQGGHKERCVKLV